ncbi:GD10293 [Drosophila simulans]|uniref:GD10293 n=1 Tax=Drosophila simulans TaxID=7240 RepID=B4QDR8_DROSI|nr:GD10293 [Drosophila simulans]
MSKSLHRFHGSSSVWRVMGVAAFNRKRFIANHPFAFYVKNHFDLPIFTGRYLG